MKRDLHPKEYEITLIDTKGGTRTLRVHARPESLEIRLEVDRHNHPA